ncbi:MAG: hypothetical protein K9J81_04310 [Desulfohalobiaceae bacterium]|nr:hypothetical protein [Desulfohalobiaceae bacterium]
MEKLQQADLLKLLEEFFPAKAHQPRRPDEPKISMADGKGTGATVTEAESKSSPIMSRDGTGPDVNVGRPLYSPEILTGTNVGYGEVLGTPVIR